MSVTFRRNQSRFFSIVSYGLHLRMLIVNFNFVQDFPHLPFSGEVSPNDGNAKGQSRNQGLTVKEQTGSLKRYPQTASVNIVTAVSILKNRTIVYLT
jgi:hypothetical protein